jgi:hydroxymethylbilane synthase
MTQSLHPYRIGTRGSPLAIKQTEIVRAQLAAIHSLDLSDFEIVALRTTGDRILDRPLADAGGKGLFTKEIDEALLSGKVDFAVHSAKDVPTFLTEGMSLAAYPPRDDPRDVLVSEQLATLETLPRGAVVGTSSIRRQALVKRLRPDLTIKLMRGNVETRLNKIAKGEFDAAVLAFAGLKRLGHENRVHVTLDPVTFPPAVGQGAIAIAVRANDDRMSRFVAAIDDKPTNIALSAERAFLAVLDGSCRAPIAGHARIMDERVHFYGLVISPDGTGAVETTREGPVGDAERLGADAGTELRARAPVGVLDA